MQPVMPIMPDILNTLLLIRHGGGKAEGNWQSATELLQGLGLDGARAYAIVVCCRYTGLGTMAQCMAVDSAQRAAPGVT